MDKMSGRSAPIVSIIVAVYNDEKRVAEAIESALAQTLEDVEVIVVDDGSTDNTPEVLERYRDRITIIRQQNRGVSAARNAGIAASHSKYVCFLDSDDMLTPNKAEAQASFLDRHPKIGLCSGIWQRADEPARSSSKIRRPRFPKSQVLMRRLAFGSIFPVNAPLVRREWLEKVKGLDERIKSAEDWDLWCRLSAAGCRFSAIDSVVAIVRLRPDSKSRNPEFVHQYRMMTLDNYFSALGARTPTSLERAARSRVWLRTGADLLRLGQRDAARDAWANSLTFDEDVLTEFEACSDVIRHLDPDFPLRHPKGLPYYEETWNTLRSISQELSATGPSARGNKGHRMRLSYLALALSKLAFSRGMSWKACRWLWSSIWRHPPVIADTACLRLIIEILIGLRLTRLLQRALLHISIKMRRWRMSPGQSSG